MKGELHLELSSKILGAGVVREVRLTQDGTRDVTRISYDIVGATQPEQPAVLDGFVLGILLHAMGNGAPLSVHGAMSRSALCNYETLQSCWALWRPQRYKRIDIRPERIVDLERLTPGRPAISAFSGGADSTFTLLRHKMRVHGTGCYNLGAALMVHGFDVSLDNVDHFEKLAQSRKPFLNELGVELRVVRTNIKELNLQIWDDAHGAMLASCLHQFAGEFDFGLIAGGDPYDALLLPWGSSPVTDHLYSGDGLTVVHDGAGFPKVEKIALISQFPTAMQGLHVCYEGAEQYRNCGHCSKCVNTRLAFMAVGQMSPPCFEGPLDLAEITAMRIQKTLTYNRLSRLAAYADRQNVKDEWLNQVKKRLNAYRREILMRRVWTACEAKIGSSLGRVGLKEPAKRGLLALRLRS
jgi:hypothetical protein